MRQGKSEETIRQEKVRKKFKDLEKLILNTSFEDAKSKLEELEADKDVVSNTSLQVQCLPPADCRWSPQVKRLLSETITQWDVLRRATDSDAGIEVCHSEPCSFRAAGSGGSLRPRQGLNMSETELQEWDSGALCPHPEPPPKTEEEIEVMDQPRPAPHQQQLRWPLDCHPGGEEEEDRAADVGRMVGAR